MIDVPVVCVEDLRVRYPGTDREAVAGVSFVIRPGEIFGLLGPNGAGKSTTQHVLTGRLPASEGRAEVLGRAVADWGPDLYTRIGVCFELPAYFPKLTARENLAAFTGIYSGATMSPTAALELVDLADAADRSPATFSKGMKIRLNLARALLHRPRVLFLDEPTAGLDPIHAAQVHRLIGDLAAEGATVFLTTHDMTTVEQVCHRVAFMTDGEISAIDTPRALRIRHGRRRVSVEHRVNGELRHAEFPLTDPTDRGLLECLRAGGVEAVHTQEASLREVFIAVTGGDL